MGALRPVDVDDAVTPEHAQERALARVAGQALQARAGHGQDLGVGPEVAGDLARPDSSTATARSTERTPGPDALGIDA